MLVSGDLLFEYIAAVELISCGYVSEILKVVIKPSLTRFGVKRAPMTQRWSEFKYILSRSCAPGFVVIGYKLGCVVVLEILAARKKELWLSTSLQSTFMVVCR